MPFDSIRATGGTSNVIAKLTLVNQALKFAVAEKLKPVLSGGIVGLHNVANLNPISSVA